MVYAAPSNRVIRIKEKPHTKLNGRERAIQEAIRKATTVLPDGTEICNLEVIDVEPEDC